MAQHFETGHAKNVANLQKLIEQITTYSNYNPNIDNLKLPALTILYNNSLAIIDNVKDKRIANKDAIHTRQDLYTDLKSKSTRIINQLDILNLKDGTFAQAKSLNKQIQGSRSSNKQEEENGEQETKTISTSRQSYTQIAENLSKLLHLLETITEYDPNTEDLKVASLQTYYTNLVEATHNVNITEAEYNTALIQRNNNLYNEENGLFEIAQNVKKYVKSVYGATSPEFSKVTRIKFATLL